jgi:hypothetical protein
MTRSIAHSKHNHGEQPNSLASSILFDSSVTLGALLGVRHQPVARLGIVRALFLPELDVTASERLMVVGISASV